MTLEKYLEKQSLQTDRCGPICLARSKDGEIGIAYMLGGALSEKWRAGDVIVLWENGEHTAPDGLEVVKTKDLWSALNKLAKLR